LAQWPQAASHRTSQNSGALFTASVIRGHDADVRSGFRTRPVTMIRKGDWKPHLFHEEWHWSHRNPKRRGVARAPACVAGTTSPEACCTAVAGLAAMPP
jgi:hypothetical protein